MKYFLGFLAAVALIIVVFVLILRGFSSRAPENQVNMLDYATTDIYVQMTVDGPVVADQDHRVYRITVDRTRAAVQVMRGYQSEVINMQSYDSNEQSYAAFLRALQLVGYTKGDSNPAKADERGYCSEASRYSFEIIKDGKKIQHFWATDCGGGTYKGNRAKTQNLFLNQIPDYRKILAGLSQS